MAVYQISNNAVFEFLMSPRTKYGWTDKMCMTEGQKRCVWKEIPAREVEAHLIRFTNLWFTGEYEEQSDIFPTIRAVVLMTPLGMSNELLLRNVFKSATETAQVPAAIDNDDFVIKQPRVDHLSSDNQKNVFKLHNWLQDNFLFLRIAREKTLRGRFHSRECTLASRKLRAVLGFCALMLMRLLSKNVTQMSRFFGYRAGKTFDCLFPDARLPFVLVAPAPEFLKLASSTIVKSSCEKQSIDLLYLLIFQYLKSTITDEASSRLTREILEEGCLKYMQGNGLGLVTMFQSVKLIFPNIEKRKLLSVIACSAKDAESRKRLTNFLDTYTRLDKPEYSWKWARILSQDYFSDMNIRKNLFLSAKFAALLANIDPSVLQHKDLQSHDTQVKSATKWAESAMKILKEVDEKLQPTAEE